MTACLAASRVVADAAISSPFPGYTSLAVSVPATTPKCTPSRMQSMAAAVAALAERIFDRGWFMDPETSSRMTSAAVLDATSRRAGA